MKTRRNTEIRKCAMCLEEYPYYYFNSRTGGYCRTCQKDYMRDLRLAKLTEQEQRLVTANLMMAKYLRKPWGKK